MCWKGQRLSAGSAAERKIILFSAVLCLLMTFLDQFTKYLVVRHIEIREHIRIIPGCFDLTYITNDGAAWNMLAGKFWLLCLISFAVLILLIVFFRKLTDGWMERYFAVFLVISGIAGNSIDRIFRNGEVVDFLHCYIGKYAWPTFNIADSCICIGVFFFIFSNMLRPEKKVPPAGNAEP